jgi:carbon storage regulator
MLVLSRKSNESLLIDNRILVKVVKIRGRLVQIGIEAPPEVVIRRAELSAPHRFGNETTGGRATGQTGQEAPDLGKKGLGAPPAVLDIP